MGSAACGRHPPAVAAKNLVLRRAAARLSGNLLMVTHNAGLPATRQNAVSAYILDDPG
jgi:hypothetical protein